MAGVRGGGGGGGNGCFRNVKAIFEHMYEEPKYVVWNIEWLDC